MIYLLHFYKLYSLLFIWSFILIFLTVVVANDEIKRLKSKSKGNWNKISIQTR